MLYYNSDFHFDTASKLKLNGYYQVRQVFGSYTTNGRDYRTHEPTFGYLRFFSDGFCKVGWWNGFFKSPAEIRDSIVNNAAFGFWGIYKTDGDTLHLEYLYNPGSQGSVPVEERETLVGLLRDQEIIVLSHAGIKYSYPGNPGDSLTSSCIGRFVAVSTTYDESGNDLKRNIHKFQ